MAKLTLNDLGTLTNDTSGVTLINSNNTLIEAAIENSLSRDGTAPNEMESSIDMNGNRIYNMFLVPTTNSDVATKYYVDTLAGTFSSANDTAIQNLPMESGSTIKWAVSDVILTHSTGVLTLAPGDLRITTAGSNSASVVTVGGTQTLTNKTLTSALTLTAFTPTTNDGNALGSGALSFSDLFLASGGVINWNNGTVNLTQSGTTLTTDVSDFNVTRSNTGTNTVTVTNANAGAAADTRFTLSNGTDTAVVIKRGTGHANPGQLVLSNSHATASIDFNTNNTSRMQLNNSTLFPTTNDGVALGTGTNAFADLFLATGGIINYANGNVVLTHSTGVLTLGTGDLQITTAGSNAASVVTVGGSQTLTSKTLTAPTITNTAATINTVTPVSASSANLGSGTLPFGTLFLGASGVINFGNGQFIATNAASIVGVSAGQLQFIGAATVFGYGNGAGGTVTQITSKSTGVTLSRPAGQITMNNAALAADTTVSFTLTNTTIASTDVLILNHLSGGTVGSYLLNAQCGAGNAVINVRNITAGSLGEAIVISYVLIKSSNT